MLLAVNYSPQAAALLAERRIAPDLFKCPHWPDLLAEARSHHPAYVHFSLKTGGVSIAEADWPAIARELEGTPTHHVNVHLVATGEAFGEIALDDASPGAMGRIADRFVADVEQVTARFGPERVVAENTIYFGPAVDYRLAGVLPETVSAVVRATGCGLLLDLAHARITCVQLGLDPREYIERLPVDRLAELHVTGAGYHEPLGRWRDHLAMSREDWELAEWAMRRIHEGAWPRPRIVALEYGGVGPLFEWRSEAAVLAEQFPRLAAMARAADSGDAGDGRATSVIVDSRAGTGPGGSE